MLLETELEAMQASVYEDENGPRYFAEALANFRVGSYRSCVLMLSNAVFAHIDVKLRQAALIDPRYRQAVKDVDDRKESGDAFEARLLSCLRPVGLLEKKKIEYLDELRSMRNRSAHPAGKNVREFEAAYLLQQSVKLFLEHRNLDPLVTVEEIVGRLQHSDYFTDSDAVADQKIIAAEVALLTGPTHMRLIERVVKLFIAHDPDAALNATKFLCGCARIDEASMHSALAKKLFFTTLSMNTAQRVATDNAVLRVIAIEPRCVEMLGPDEKKRLDSRLVRMLDATDGGVSCPSLAASWVANSAEGTALSAVALPGVVSLLKQSLNLGYVLLSSASLPSAVRKLVISNIVSSVERAPSTKQSELLAFIEENGEALPPLLRGEEAYRIWVALENRRVSGPSHRRNISKVGAFITEPSAMRLPDNEASLAKLEVRLREVVRGVFASNPEEMTAYAHRQKKMLHCPDDIGFTHSRPHKRVHG